MSTERCTYCGGTIPAASQAFVYQDHVVCRNCKDSLEKRKSKTYSPRYSSKVIQKEQAAFLRSDANRLIVYTICFSLSPAVIVCLLENKYHIFFRHSIVDDLFFLFFLIAIFLFGVVLAVWRTVNKPQEKESLRNKTEKE